MIPAKPTLVVTHAVAGSAAGLSTSTLDPAGTRITSPAAAQLVDELAAKGYVERHPDPADARARLIALTEKGWACTRAADAAMADTLRPWAEALGEQRLLALRDDLIRIAAHGPLRPMW